MTKTLQRFGHFFLFVPLLILILGLRHYAFSQNQTAGVRNDSTLNKGASLPEAKIKESLAGFQDSNVCSGGIPKYSKLCEASNGKLYGLTCYGGQYNSGVLFEFNPSDKTGVIRVNFDTLAMGSNPYGSLMKASNNKLYGMTRSGGKYAFGVLFEYDPIQKVFRKLIDFKGVANGCCPHGGLIESSAGHLYGLTTRGGRYNSGVLFEYIISENSLNKLVDFKETESGSFPHGTLVEAADGKLYGMTKEGGKYGYGTLFEFNPATKTLSVKFDFDGSGSGCFPRGELVPYGDNLLYGLTASGGKNKFGVMFYYDIRKETFHKVLDFSDKQNGICPLGSLLYAETKQLYGMTYQGGENGFGVLFEYNPADQSYSKKVDFDGLNGKYPFGSLIQASNSKIYGMTQFGGASGGGVLFEYHPDTGMIEKIFDFRGYNYIPVSYE